MSDDGITPEERDDLLLTLERMHHTMRLGIDAMRLLHRCLNECDMDPDLAVDVATLLLRFTDHAEHAQRG